jgi:tRNA dimethylallyltransferase
MKPFLLVITGPTASGKTELAIEVAQKFHTSILSADSRQFFKEMNAGTAKPSPKQLSAVQHYFISHISIHDTYNASLYEKDAIELINSILKEKKICILVGGSGLYIDAVCKGFSPLPDVDKEIRRQVLHDYESYGIEYLAEKIKVHDPEYYGKVDTSNPRRLLRAAEIIYQTGKSFSSFLNMPPKSREFDIIRTAWDLPSEELASRIWKRTQKMISEGLLEEVKELYAFKELAPLKSIGYQELFEYIDGKISFEEAVEKIITHSRQYAKKQKSYFRRDKDIHWFRSGNTEEFIAYVHKKINNLN